MPILSNPRWERFAQEVAKGISGAEAYRSAGYSANANAAAVAATRLLKDPNVRARVNELLAEREKTHAQASAKAVERVALTKEWVLAKLIENAERALQSRPVRLPSGDEVPGEYKYEGSVANRALELLGKELGMFIDRKEQGAPGEFASLDTAEDIKRAIAERLGLVGSGDAASGLSGREGSGRGKPH